MDSRYVKKFNTFVKGTIAEKDTFLGAKREFALVIRSKVWPASIAKHTKGFIVRCGVEKTLCGSFKIEHLGRE